MDQEIRLDLKSGIFLDSSFLHPSNDLLLDIGKLVTDLWWRDLEENIAYKRLLVAVKIMGHKNWYVDSFLLKVDDFSSKRF